MLATVADILKVEPISMGRLVAGGNGLNRVVRGVTVLEVSWIEIPEGQVFTHAGDIVVSSMYSVMNSVDEQIRTVRMIKEQEASALCLCHLGMVIKELSPRLIDECNRLALPLIVMPTNLSYSAIITVVSQLVLSQENEALGSKMKMYDSIIDMLLPKNSNRGVITNLSNLIGCRALYFNHNLRAEEDAGLPEDYLNYIREQIRKNVLAFMDSYEQIIVPGYQSGPPLLLYPLYSNIMYYGVIVVERTRALTELDEAAILQTKNALNIMHLHKTDVFEQRMRLMTEYIDDLIHGYCSNEQLLINRSAYIGHALSHTRAVIVVDIFGFQQLVLQLDEQKVQALKREFVERTDALLRRISPESISCNISDKHVALVTGDIPEDKTAARLKYIANQIRDTLRQNLQLEVSVGIGSHCRHFREIKDSYRSAITAINISNRIYKKPRIVFGDEFPVYRYLLNAVNGREDVCRRLEGELIEPLRTYDKKSNSCLEETYRVLLECDLDTNLVAQRMYIHKNTVLQRKRKIIELCPRDPFDLENRLQFQFARGLNELTDIPKEPR